MRRIAVIILFLSFCAPGIVTAQERCGIENCHGIDIVCGPNIPEACTAMYAMGDFCRAYARCEVAEGACRLAKDPAFEACAGCVRECAEAHQNDPAGAFGCEAKCRERIAGENQATAGISSQEQMARKPVLVLEEAARSEPQAGAWPLNQLNPDFVLYADGLVIFKNAVHGREAVSVQLTSAEMNKLLEELNIGDDFMGLDDSYYMSNEFHLPLSIIKYWPDGKMKRVMVAGRIRDSEEHRQKAPPAFLKLFDRIISFDHPNVRLWEPGKVEIVIFPYTNAEGEPAPWPKGWPDLTHATTKKADYAGGFTLLLDGNNKDELERMITRKQAVSINGRTWIISPHRYVYPSEELWSDAVPAGPLKEPPKEIQPSQEALPVNLEKKTAPEGFSLTEEIDPPLRRKPLLENTKPSEKVPEAQRKISKVYYDQDKVYSETDLFSDVNNGFYRTFHRNGQLQSEVRYQDGWQIYDKAFNENGQPLIRNGQVKNYYTGGSVLSDSVQYKNDKKHGVGTYYFYDGKTVVDVWHYLDGRQAGIHTRNDQYGKLVYEEDWGYPTYYVERLKMMIWGLGTAVVLLLGAIIGSKINRRG